MTRSSPVTPDLPDASAPLPPAAVRLIVLGAMLVLFLAALDQTIVSTALPAIGSALGRLELISWIITAYLLTSTCASAVFGRVSDLYGRRPIMRVVLSIFLVGSVWCALSTSMPMLIAGRALQGVGGGGLLTLSQTILADVISPRDRGKYSAYFSIVWAGSSLLGPLLGGVLTQFASWQWIFWINLPIGLGAMGLSDRLLRRLQIPARRLPIDYLGILWLVLGTTALLLALSWGGVTFPWASLPVAAAALVFLVMAWLFFRRQSQQDTAFLPPRFFQNAVVGPMLLANFLGAGAFVAVSVLTPAFLQIGLGRSPGEAGILMVPVLIGSTLTANWAGRRVSKTGNYKHPPLIGLPIAILGLFVLAFFAHSLSPGAAAIILAVVGLGSGPIFPVATVATQNAVQRIDFGAVSGAVAFSRALGTAIMTAAASALVLTLITRWVPSAAAAAGLEDLVRQGLSPFDHEAVLSAFAAMFWFLGSVMLLAVLVFLRVESRPLEKNLPPVEVEAL